MVRRIGQDIQGVFEAREILKIREVIQESAKTIAPESVTESINESPVVTIT